MTATEAMTTWQRWLRRPQKIWLRRALFQAHLWSGIAIGIYVFVISFTGSVLVYRNELYRAATPKPIITKSTAPRLSDEQLSAAVTRLYPGYRIINLGRARNPDELVTVRVQRNRVSKSRLFDPRTGEDIGNAVPPGIRFVSGMIDLHDNLFGGMTGRLINGLGAVLLLILGITGMVVWWPGVRSWRKHLVAHRGRSWRRLIWELHGMIGFWSFAFLIIFGISGIYLVIPDRVQDLADWIEPQTPANMASRVTDRIIYWVAYLHFGRINGIGIPCKGRGLCDQTTKAVWALFGIAPAAMVVTGVMMWWNRVIRPQRKRSGTMPLTHEVPGDVERSLP